MDDSLQGKLCTYSAKFSPRPLLGVRFANPDIVRRFEDEMDRRWDYLQMYLETIGERSRYKDTNETLNGMVLWQHAEGGTLTPEKEGLFLPTKYYGLVAVYDVVHVIHEKGDGFDREMEVLFSVKEHDFVAGNVKEIMENGLPSDVVVGKAWRYRSVETGGGFSIRHMDRF